MLTNRCVGPRTETKPPSWKVKIIDVNQAKLEMDAESWKVCRLRMKQFTSQAFLSPRVEISASNRQERAVQAEIITRTVDNFHHMSPFATRDPKKLIYPQIVGSGFFFDTIKTVPASQLQSRIRLFQQDMSDQWDLDRAA